jgi:hypothetical protein
MPLIAVTALFGGSVALGQESSNDVAKPIEQCIRQNAPSVERTIPSLTEATDFLVQDRCARPLADEKRRIRKISMDAMLKQQKECEARQRSNSQHEQDIGECMYSPGVETIVVTASETGRPPGPTALAAKVLLDLRNARENATHTQGSH